MRKRESKPTYGDRVAAGRLLDLDSLKALASFFIVLNHASYNLLLDSASDPKTLVVFEHFRSMALAFVPLRVPLFLLVAGVFTAIGLRRYTVRSYFRNRFVRILIPFLFGGVTFAFIVNAFQHHLWTESRLVESYLKFINPFGNGDYGHLWFLFVVLVYSLVCMGCVLAAERFEWLRNRLVRARDFLLSHGFVLMTLIFLIAAAKLVGRSRGWFDAMDVSGKLPLGAVLWNANYFAMGVLFGSDLPAFYRFLFFSLRKWVIIVAATVLLGVAGHFLAMRVPLLLYSASADCLPLLVLLAIFHRYFRACPEPLQTMSTYSYPVFILHMPVLSTCTAALLALKMDPLMIFFVVMITCYPLSLVLAKWLTQVPFFTLVLQGKWKSRQSIRDSEARRRSGDQAMQAP